MNAFTLSLTADTDWQSCIIFYTITPCQLPPDIGNFQSGLRTIVKWRAYLLLAGAGSMTTLRVELMKVTFSHQYLQMAQWVGTAASDRLCPCCPCGLVHSALIEHAPLLSAGKWERKQGALAKSHHPAAVDVPGSFLPSAPTPSPLTDMGAEGSYPRDMYKSDQTQWQCICSLKLHFSGYGFNIRQTPSEQTRSFIID